MSDFTIVARPVAVPGQRSHVTAIAQAIIDTAENGQAVKFDSERAYRCAQQNARMQIRRRGLPLMVHASINLLTVWAAKREEASK